MTNSCRGIVVFIVGINYCAVSTQVFGFIVYLRLGGSILLIIIPLNPLISFTKAKEHKKFFLSRDSLISSQGLEYKKKGKGSALVGVPGFSVFFLLIFYLLAFLLLFISTS